MLTDRRYLCPPGAALAAALAICACQGDVPDGHRGSAREDITKRIVAQYAMEAYPLWARNHPDAACPGALAELVDYTNQKAPVDAWDAELTMLCGKDAPPEAKGFGVFSKGADGKLGTADDIKSWELPPR